MEVPTLLLGIALNWVLIYIVLTLVAFVDLTNTVNNNASIASVLLSIVPSSSPYIIQQNIQFAPNSRLTNLTIQSTGGKKYFFEDGHVTGDIIVGGAVSGTLISLS